MPDTTFRDLHRPGQPFLLANAWDAGSARMLEALGAEAIGTSSAAHAFTLGRPDMGHVTRDEALAHAQSLVAAVNLPVSGDFENGFGEAPETCAETVRLSAEAGLAGISIEDTALPDAAPYAFDLAVDRIRAAAAAARALPRDFVLVARADGVLNGQYDLDEALRRIAAYQATGADCVYIPFTSGFEHVARICAAVSVPVNILVAGDMARHNRAAFAAAGAARLSLGSSLARTTHRMIHDLAQQMFDDGSFTGLADHGISGKRIDALLARIP